MKSASKLALAFFVTAALTAGHTQSLGDAARKLQQNRAPSATKRVVTNDEIVTGTPLATAESNAQSSSASNQPPQAGAQENSEAKKPATAASTGSSASAGAQSGEDETKALDAWKKRFADARKAVKENEREIDLLQREQKLRTASFYADAGLQLRDGAKYAELERQSKDSIGRAQQQLDAAKKSLEDLEEEARKAGVPASVRSE